MPLSRRLNVARNADRRLRMVRLRRRMFWLRVRQLPSMVGVLLAWGLAALVALPMMASYSSHGGIAVHLEFAVPCFAVACAITYLLFRQRRELEERFREAQGELAYERERDEADGKVCPLQGG